MAVAPKPAATSDHVAKVRQSLHRINPALAGFFDGKRALVADLTERFGSVTEDVRVPFNEATDLLRALDEANTQGGGTDG